MKYFTAAVKFKRLNDKGKIKTTTERYLVDALTVTEAEGRVINLLKDSVDDYEISGVQESRIIEVIPAK